jgi:uncharacterized protein
MKNTYLCPVDQGQLVMSERQGVEIDYCPICRGVWLDRGELDKIIEKNSAAQSPQPAVPPQPEQAAWAGQPPNHGHSGYGRKSYKRRKSFLEELFD